MRRKYAGEVKVTLMDNFLKDKILSSKEVNKLYIEIIYHGKNLLQN